MEHRRANQAYESSRSNYRSDVVEINGHSASLSINGGAGSSSGHVNRSPMTSTSSSSRGRITPNRLNDSREQDSPMFANPPAPPTISKSKYALNAVPK